MDLETLVGLALNNGASDLHLESGLPAALRVRGALKTFGEPIPPKALLEFARDIVGEGQWPRFWNSARSISPRRFMAYGAASIFCRHHAGSVRHSPAGVIPGHNREAQFASGSKEAGRATNGLILVSGPTGCGKSSTLAALIQEINLTETRHIVTIESPLNTTFARAARTSASARSGATRRASSRPCSMCCAKIPTC